MTRRILFVLLGFTAIVLVGAVVPLTLNATSHDRNSFSQALAGMARTDAAIAQAYLNMLAEAKHSKTSASAAQGKLALLTVAKETREAGYGLLVLSNVYDPAGNVAGMKVVGNPEGLPAGDWGQDSFATRANAQAQTALQADQPIQPVTETVGSDLMAALPVYEQGGQNGQHVGWVGTVILASSTKPLDNEILELWAILGSVAAVAMIAAALLAFGLARWVSRPLKSLDTAARRLADGDLAIRAKVGSGPPELRRLGTTFNTMAGARGAGAREPGGHRGRVAPAAHPAGRAAAAAGPAGRRYRPGDRP